MAELEPIRILTVEDHRLPGTNGTDALVAIRGEFQLSNGHVQWTDGMLYPVLHRLERHGLVASRWRSSESGRRRKYYRLTKEGRTQLEAERKRWQIVDATLNRIWMRACLA